MTRNHSISHNPFLLNLLTQSCTMHFRFALCFSLLCIQLRKAVVNAFTPNYTTFPSFHIIFV